MEEKATEKNKSLELAAGAGMAGQSSSAQYSLERGLSRVKMLLPVGTEFYEVMGCSGIRPSAIPGA